jgi:Ni/Co efflux regulator RcnB
MSGNASPFRTAAVALALAVAWLGTVAVAQPDDRGRGGGRGNERRWVQPADPGGARGGDRGGDRRWVQQADPRGGRDWQDRREQRRLERERPDGWRGQPERDGAPWGRQDHPGRGGPPVYVQPPVYGQPPVHVQPPPQVQPSPQWEGRGGDRAERRWNPRAPRLRPGDQLPSEYRQRQFVVNDWRAHRLYAPPPGHQWVQPEPGNYILIGRNGEIVNMLVGQ